MPPISYSSRRTFLVACALAPLGVKSKFSGSFGLQIYSLRGEAEKDLAAALAMIRSFGITEVEVPGMYGRKAKEFRRLLDQADLKATSMMADHARLVSKINSVVEDALVLGVEYVVCSTIPHSKKHLVLAECDQAAKDFNRWGKTLAQSKLRLGYHTHGIEFDTAAEGTLFDGIVQHTDPALVNFEMDIFWMVFAHQDPAKWLRRYPGRFPLMHVKDIRKDTPLGGSPGDVLEEASVILGEGLVDIPATLQAAQASGVLHYYIEDEAVDAADQIPKSLRYLKNICQ